MKNKIILMTDAKLEDEEARKEITKLTSKIDIMNERTKNHTKEIKELQKQLKLIPNNFPITKEDLKEMNEGK